MIDSSHFIFTRKGSWGWGMHQLVSLRVKDCAVYKPLQHQGTDHKWLKSCSVKCLVILSFWKLFSVHLAEQMTVPGLSIVNVIWELNSPIQVFPSDYSCSSLELMVLLIPAKCHCDLWLDFG